MKLIKLDRKHSEYIGRSANGREVLKAEIECDTLSELVGLTSLGNVDFAAGSRAHVIKDAELCSFSSDKKWYKQSDSSEVM